MNRRGRHDVAMVGGGVVGASAALLLARSGLDVALIEASEPRAWHAAHPDLRVYAIAPDNAALLNALGVWHGVVDARAKAYRRMRVWDAAGGGELVFDADAFARTELGWIVEHGLLVDRLWKALSRSGVRLHCPARVEQCEQFDDRVRLQLDDGLRVEAAIAVAADGADSTLRQLANMPIARHDYGQRGIVAYVDSAQPHEDTAWQRFLSTGPLAFLPCADLLGERVGHRSSIVWTVPDHDAVALIAADDRQFGHALTNASGGRLGDIAVTSARAAFPLRRQLAQQLVQGRVLVVGDAAHVVHPLAGQGVNLGLRDVAALCASVDTARAKGVDWSSPQRLARWARKRKSENALAAHAFDGINRVFSSDNMLATLLRGPALGIAGRIPPLAYQLWCKASGLA